jgi:hypothetical protein
VPGPEDFEIQAKGPGAPRLIISSDERGDKKTKTRADGGLFSLSLANGGAGAMPLGLMLVGREKVGCSFHPHGISLVTLSSGQQRLYVINHHEARNIGGCLLNADGLAAPHHGKEIHSIEVFDLIDGGAWKLVDRLTAPEFLTHPNDVAASPDGLVYVTNAPLTTFGFGYEALIGHSSSSVVVVDDREKEKKWYRVAGRPRIANGIAIDWARKRLYVAETGTERIDVLALDGAGGPTAPVRVGEIEIGSGVDNLSWELPGPDSRLLWVAADPHLGAFVKFGIAYGSAHRHHKDPKSRSASEVYQVVLDGNSGRRNPSLEPFFCDDGTMISAASVAIPYESSLFVGQVFEDFVLRISDYRQIPHVKRDE